MLFGIVFGRRVPGVTLGVAAAALGGCVSFVPSYNQDMYERLSDVQTQLSRISVQVSIAAPGKADYAKVEPYYVAALGDVAQAKDITDAAAAYAKGRLSAQTASDLTKMVANCATAIEQDRAYFAQGGQPGNELDNLKTVRDTCSVPKNVADMMKG